ncbi:MAG: alkaline phosphatase family protein [Chitinophagaceae bacterium]|nr:alkaline phosphatase family protein [Chitinophagaceae bacterium]
MIRSITVFFSLAFLCLSAVAQKAIVAGPMPGHVELRTAKIWLQFRDNIKEAAIHYRSKAASKLLTKKIQLEGGEFNTAEVTITGLEPSTDYIYYITAGAGKNYLDSGAFSTQTIWQFRNPPPDFSFLAGSCTYFNEMQYDRPGAPYGQDSTIFNMMAKEKSAFMLWLGDNWYTRYPDFHSEWGLNYRPSRDRQMPVLQKFLKSMSHYGIWDDHDYGPNDADKSYVLKEASRRTFMKFWANPGYGFNGQGIYTMFNYNDADFFLLDDRWWRSSDRMKDSVNGQPNPEKTMFGKDQVDWLKNALLFSKANNFTKFRVIVTGSQVLNQLTRFDSFNHFPVEYEELMRFIEDNKINGVVFITGDRHHSEVLRLDRKNAYTLYDVTVSPLTSRVAKTQGAEVNNPDRVGPEMAEQNYGRFSVSGEANERRLTVEFIGLKGDVLFTWSVKASELMNE